MLVVVGDAAQLGEGDLFRRRAGHFDHAVFDDQFGRFDFEIEGGELKIFSRSLVAAPWIAPMSYK